MVSGSIWKARAAGLEQQGEPDEGPAWDAPALPLRQLHIDDPTMVWRCCQAAVSLHTAQNLTAGLRVCVADRSLPTTLR